MAPDLSADAGLCLSNSLDWYGSVLRAHGLSGRVSDGIWVCGDAVPPYYSNAVTVSPSATEPQTVAIARLARALDRTFSVKDSFAALDLEPLGFRLLFTADWTLRSPSDDHKAARRDAWQRIAAASDLGRWEAVWQANGSPADRRVFPPAILDDPALTFLARWQDDRIVAGCAANRSTGAIGFSNFFTESADPGRDYRSAVAAVAARASGLPVVGYEHGSARDWALDAGFRAVGPLRVWLCQPA